MGIHWAIRMQSPNSADTHHHKISEKKLVSIKISQGTLQFLRLSVKLQCLQQFSTLTKKKKKTHFVSQCCLESFKNMCPVFLKGLPYKGVPPKMTTWL